MRIWIIRLLLLIIFLLTFYNEFIVYVLKPITTWPEIKCNHSETCTKILIIADPQLLGEQTESAIARFDNDRYLRNSFSVALEHVRPDGIIFLGDLADEGSWADDDQFQRYYDRFKSIFQFDKISQSSIPIILIPGDNDIGGENNEVIKAKNVQRFRKYFGKEETEIVKDIRISKVNKLLRTYPSLDENTSHKSKLNIAISHIPLTAEYISPFTEHVVNEIRPDFIFSAHEHKSFALLTLRENGRRLYYEELKYNTYRGRGSTWTFQAARVTNYTVITEIVVPTCSYRMGVSDMGYSVIIYDHESSGILYHVLWLPSRFTQLILYFIFFIICGIFVWTNFSYLRRAFRKNNICSI